MSSNIARDCEGAEVLAFPSERIRSAAPEVDSPREPLMREAIGQVLRNERQLQQRTLREVADDAAISVQYLSEIERGRKEASSEVLRTVTSALHLQLADLAGQLAQRLGNHTTQLMAA